MGSLEPTYRLRFFFDWRADCLWSDNDAARARFDYPVDPADLPLSLATRDEMGRVCGWHDTSLNWDYPPDPGPWREEECARFNAAARALLAAIRAELRPDYEIVDEFRDVHEDPDLDAYLADPKGFRRQR